MAVSEQSGLRSTSTGTTLVISASALAGDVAVVSQQATNFGSTPATVNPTGFTQLALTTQDVGGNVLKVMVSAKLLIAGDIGATITGMNGDANDRKQCFIFRSDLGPMTAMANGMTWNAPPGTSGAPAAQTITSGAGTPPLVALAFGATDGAIDFVGSTAWDAEVLFADSKVGTCFKIYNSSPVNHTADGDDNGSYNVIVSGYITMVEPGGQPTVKRASGTRFMGSFRAPPHGRVWAPNAPVGFSRRSSGLLMRKAA